MLVSIITATYNSSEYIKKCIKSVLAQRADFCEHIIIDGKSTDNTLKIINQYSHIKWISEPDKGVYDALNKGLKIATGEWIYFLGSDDELITGTLQKLEEELNLSSLDILYGSVWVKRTERSYDGFFSTEKFLVNNICQQAIFYRRKLFQNNFFNLAYPIAADYALNIPLFTNRKLSIKFLSFDIALYDGNGISERLTDKKFLTQKVSIFSQALHKKREDAFFDGYRHQEAINQILYGNILLGWYEIYIHGYRKKVLLKSLYTALAMTKVRVLKTPVAQTK